MHQRSRPVLLRLREPAQLRTAATAAKPARLPSRNWEAPPTLSDAETSLPSLGKWGRPDGLPQRLSSRAPPTTKFNGRSGRVSDNTPSRDLEGTRPESSRAASSKWRRPISFPMLPVGSEAASRTFSRDPLPHLTKPAGQGFFPQQPSQRAPRPSEHTPPSSGVTLVEESFDEPPHSDYAHGGWKEHNFRRSKVAFKERGSLKRAYKAETPSRDHNRDKPSTPRAQAAKPKTAPRTFRKAKPDVFIPSIISVGNLARVLNVTLARLQRKMREAGMGDDASYDHVLTSEYAALLAEEFHRNPVVNDEAAFDLFPPLPPPDTSALPLRPPIVTIMGHVDHGKTTLLDTLRSASVAKGEAGGITQHIGAFSVPVPNSTSGGLEKITFLDTPGHAAFSAMRARGADVTDIVVLVVAADDGVRPQTKEVIQLVQKDPNVQLIVAINKVDKPGIDINNVHLSLMAEGIQLEAMGGDIPSVEVSGLTGKGLDQLVETISAVAEMQDLRADRAGQVHGHIIESKMQKGLGPVATVLLLRGSLKPGAHLIAGTTHAKVRLMTDSNGASVKIAGPGVAVTVSGWKDLPGAGDEVLEGAEQDVKKAVANRLRKAEQEAMLVDIDAINTQRRLDREERERENSDDRDITSEAGQPKELKLIIKGDVSGSVEALIGALEHIGNDQARVKIVDTGVGEVTDSDILLAKTSGGMIVAFSVPVPRSATAAANTHGIPVLSSKIIYQVIEGVTKHVADLLPPAYEKRVSGEASVLQIFEIKLSGGRTKAIAGCRVTKGIVDKSKKVQVLRNGEVVHEGRLDTFKHMKADITEASKGTECGIGMERFDGLKKDDVIQVYSDIELPKVL